jgi:hypothetical protein
LSMNSLRFAGTTMVPAQGNLPEQSPTEQMRQVGRLPRKRYRTGTRDSNHGTAVWLIQDHPVVQFPLNQHNDHGGRPVRSLPSRAWRKTLSTL